MGRGNVVGQQGHYPFGESWYASGTTTKWTFTSYERDAESGNDYAMFRSYVNCLGRFSSPDPLAGSLFNPQSLNRYAYVRDDPNNLADPLGLFIGIPPETPDVWWLFMMFGGAGGRHPLLIDGSEGGGGGGRDPGDPCAAKTYAVPKEVQLRMIEATTAFAITAVDISKGGDIVGFDVFFAKSFLAAPGISVPRGTGVSIHYWRPNTGLTIGATGAGIGVPTSSNFFSASVTSLQFQNGRITSLTGSIDFLGVIPIPGGQDTIKDQLNNNKQALDALKQLTSFLGKCAQKAK